MSNIKFEVCIRCTTYNQANFIKDTMNGFCMQKTSFPFVCVIIDDNSNDGEVEVIKQYIDNNFITQTEKMKRIEETADYKMLFAQHKTNSNCYFAVYFLKYNHNGSAELKKRKFDYSVGFVRDSNFIALCEGDDFWIDKEKLQDQRNFLKTHENFAMVHTDAIVVDSNNKVLYNKKNVKPEEGTTRDLLQEGNYIVTASAFFRNYYLEWCEERKMIPFPLLMGDYPMWIFFSSKGKIGYLRKQMVAYRYLPESASHSKNRDKIIHFIDNAEQIVKYYNGRYHVGLNDKEIEFKTLKGKTRLMAKISRIDFVEYWKSLLLRYPSSIFDLRLTAIAVVRIVFNMSR